MGRTLPTSRNLLDRMEEEWMDFRRALTADEQRLFDALWQKARAHASAMANQAPLDPMQAVVLAILLEHAKELQSLRRERSSAVAAGG